MILLEASEDCNIGIIIRYRTSIKLYNMRRLTPSRKILSSLVRDPLYVNGCELDTRITQPFHRATLAFRLSINLDKTLMIFQPATRKEYIEISMYVEGHRFKVFDSFVYF